MKSFINMVRDGVEFKVAEAQDAEPIHVPRLDPRAVTAFEGYRPTFFDERFGCITAELHAIVVDDGTFDTIAYYDAVVPDEGDKVRVTTYRYEIVDRVMTAVKQYPTQVLPRKEIAHRHRPRWRLMLR